MSAKLQRLWRQTERARAAVLMVVWAACSLVLGAFLMEGHVIALPAAARTSGGTQSRVWGPGAYRMVHILSGDCPCSRDILDHLLSRGAGRGIDERIVFVAGRARDTGNVGREAERRGFAFQAVDAAALARDYNAVAAPLLLIFDSGGVARYRGGYTERSRGPDPRDVKLLEEVARGEIPKPLPVFGCAIAADLKRRLDPLGLKYRGETL